jgi:hypothetical protein
MNWRDRRKRLERGRHAPANACRLDAAAQHLFFGLAQGAPAVQDVVGNGFTQRRISPARHPQGAGLGQFGLALGEPLICSWSSVEGLRLRMHHAPAVLDADLRRVAH